jgi:hypothetical protein
MFAAGPAIDADYSRPRPVAGKNAVIEAFIRYSAVQAHVTCAAFLAAGG